MKLLVFIFTFAPVLIAHTPVINEVMSLNTSTITDNDGAFPDWIELYNPSQDDFSLKDYALSDDPDELKKLIFPDIDIPGSGWLLIFASDKDKMGDEFLHTNFKISSKGETILMTSPAGVIIDSLTVPQLAADISYGRIPDGGIARAYFARSTPGRSNETDPSFGFAKTPHFSQPSGFYHGSISVKLSSNETGRIRYTTNGAVPNAHSRSYLNPIQLSKTTVVKARTFTEDKLPSPVATHTYFIDETQQLPAISLSTHPDNLFDEDIGIYVEGNGTALGGYPDNPIGPPANYWEDWERLAHIEFFEPDGTFGFGENIGLKMAGKTTRKLPQKSFAVFLRNQYGTDKLDYPLFPDSPVRTFYSFMLRNAGSDNTHNQGGVHFRDGLSALLLRELDLDYQDYRPCVLYINGEYWGIYGIREKLNEEYLATHHGVDPDNVDMLDDYHRLYPLVIEGNAKDYNALIDYLKVHNLSDEDAAAYVETQMNIDNYLTYMAVQIYLANQDGPGHNCKFWRPRTDDGRYRWLLYDTDHSFGFRLFTPNFHYAPDAYVDNTIAYYLEPDGPDWPNPPESTFMFRKIMQNRGFQIRFINILADMLNSRFSAGKAYENFKHVRNKIEPEMERHLERWGGSTSQWQQDVQIVDDFLALRPGFLQEHIMNEFDVGGLTKITLNVSPAGTGRIKVNSLTVSEPWSGFYFKDVHVQLTALPNLGYTFDSWEGIDEASASIRFELSKEVEITATFQNAENDGFIVINEINYKSPPDFDTQDWIELYNAASDQLDLSGWTFTDDDSGDAFIFPEETIILPDGYLVVCRDTDDFTTHWPNVSPLTGDFNFGLSSDGDVLMLKNIEGKIVDFVDYKPSAPWPWQPNGTGATLALRNPHDDNALPENWMASVEHGTPGTVNKDIGLVYDKTMPSTFYLNVFPNPFNSTVEIEYSLPVDQNVTIDIFDILGQHIVTLLERKQQAGVHRLKWNAVNHYGLYVASGVYFIRVSTTRFSKINKVLFVQ